MEQGQCNINFFSLYDIFWVWIIDFRAGFRSLRAAVQLHNRLITFSRLLWLCWPFRVNNFFLSCTWCLWRCWCRNGWDSANAKLILRWFAHKRSTALSIAYSGQGIGVMILVPAAQMVIEVSGWQDAYMFASYGFIVILCLVLFLPWASISTGCKTYLPEHDAR